MRRAFALIVMLGLVNVTRIASPQNPPATAASSANCPGDSARDTVQRLWDMAASGGILTHWGDVDRLFSEPGPLPSGQTVRVVTDYWWVTYYRRVDASQPIVTVESHWGKDPGVIDEHLRFTPPPPSTAVVTVGYRLVLATPQELYGWGPDGKPVMGKPNTERKAWLIQGPPPPPFMTVTAAIRYVLEKRSQTADPVVKKNADETLAQLLKMH